NPRACDTRIGHDRQDCDEPFGEHSCPHHKSGKTAKLDALALRRRSLDALYPAIAAAFTRASHGKSNLL
ncbi:MAG: hypothetical protein FWD73_11330, partial [Polyangiaceae bacterium]|nr:hypothetical protein [Polyangiaceae bacterium]